MLPAILCELGQRALHRIEFFAQHFDLALLFGNLELLRPRTMPGTDQRPARALARHTAA